MSIHAVSFGATTQKGNKYKKTHAGTAAGITLGTLAAANTANTAFRKFKPDIKLLRLIKENKDKIISTGIAPAKARKIMNVSIGIGKGVSVAATLGFYLLAGIGVNKVINLIKAHKADKAAQ